MADIQVVVNAKTDSAQQDFIKLEQRQIEVEAATKKMAQAQKQAEKTLNELANSAHKSDKNVSSLIKTAAGAVSISTAFRAAVNIVKEFDSSISNTADKMNDMIDKANGLFQVSNNPKIRALSAMHGAQYGVSPDDAALSYGYTLSRTQGDEAAAAAISESAFKMTRLGVGAEDATKAILSGSTMGLKPSEAASLIAFHAQKSDLRPENMAEIMTLITGYTTPDIGLSAADALSGVIKEEELPTIVKNAGKGLRKPGKLTKAIAQKLGKPVGEIDELTMLDNIISTLGPDAAKSWTSVQSAGVEDMEAARGIAGLATRRDFFAQMIKEKKPDGYDETVFQNMIKTFPEAAVYQKTREAEAGVESAKVTTQWGKFAQGMDLGNFQTSKKLVDRGLGFFVREDNRPSNLIDWPAKIAQMLTAANSGAGWQRQDETTLKDLSNQLDKLIGAVEKQDKKIQVKQTPDRGQAWIE